MCSRLTVSKIGFDHDGENHGERMFKNDHMSKSVVADDARLVRQSVAIGLTGLGQAVSNLVVEGVWGAYIASVYRDWTPLARSSTHGSSAPADMRPAASSDAQLDRRT